MDTLTHAAVGAALGEMVLGRRLGNRAVLWGALLGNLPDADIVLTPLTDSVHLLTWHRGPTHSLLTAVAVVPLLGWLLARWHRGGPAAGWRPWTLLVALGLLSHLFLDVCTTYGTPLLWPLSDHHFALNNLFIIDPFFTLPVTLCMVVVLFLRADRARRHWAAWGLVFCTLYTAWSFTGHTLARRAFAAALQREHVPAEPFMTAPTPLNTILWYCVAQGPDGCWLGYYSLLDRQPQIKFSFLPRNQQLVADARDDATLQRLIRFSNGYYSLHRQDGEVVFAVLKFGTLDLGGDDRHPAFSFALKPGPDGHLTARRLASYKVNWGLTIHNLLVRLRGGNVDGG